MSKETTCQICNKSYKNLLSLTNHIRTHNIKSKDYFIKFFTKEGDDICVMCGDKTNFNFNTKRYNKHCSRKCSRNNPETNKKITEKIKQTHANNPEIAINASKKRKQTFADNPEIMKVATEKRKQTLLSNPEIEEERRKKSSITHRNNYKSLQENHSKETHCLYIMEHQYKPIIKIGLTLERQLRERTNRINNDFGECQTILLLKGTYQKIDELETFLHNYFNEHCKVQPKGKGRTEWFDKEIMAEAIELASAKILES